MGRHAKRKPMKAKGPPVVMVTGIDATPERLAKDPDNDIVPAGIEKLGERQGKARQFRATHLDRLHKSGNLSYLQWYAGNVYRETHARCHFALSVVASYGERSGAAEHPGNFGFGLPRQEAQVRARDQMRLMRSEFPRELQGFMDRLLIHDSMPRYAGRAAMRNMAEIRKGLDALALYLRLT
jgi:hypothetical protein